MPYIDRRSGEMVMRIVYDGSPEAGKTTNIVKLCDAVALQRRGELKSPGTDGRRTEYFDWLDFVGGYVDGRKVRCQIVSVPGQAKVLHRRRYLLDSADAVVFVADSRPECVADSLDSLATTMRALQALGEEAPVGIVLQANKQDLHGALAPQALAQALEFPERGPVIGARALVGEGVMQSFIMAVRLATERVRKLSQGAMLSGPEATEQWDPEALYLAMLRREPGNASVGKRHSILAGDAVEQPTELRLRTLASRPNPAAREPLTLPSASELGAGHIWPPAGGRQVVTAALTDAPLAPEELAPWAEDDASELRTPGHVLHTRAGWSYASEHEARLALVGTVRRQIRVAPLLAETRVLFMSRSGVGYRVWMITPQLPSLRELLDTALSERDPALVGEVLRTAETIAAAVDALPDESDRALVPAALESFGRAPLGNWVLLALPLDLPRTESFRRTLLSPLRDAVSTSPVVASLVQSASELLSGSEERAWRATYEEPHDD